MLDCDAQHFVATAASWLASMAPSSPVRIPIFIHNYAFHHSPAPGGEVAAVGGQAEQCSTADTARLPCGALVEAEAAVGSKRLAEYFVGLLKGDMAAGAAAGRLLQQTALFGWVPCHAFVRHNMNASLFWQGASRHADKGKKKAEDVSSSQGPRIEVGGGSGAGFQVFCDDTLLVSAGGGGGGGVEGRLVPSGEGSSFSVGGGGGGGAQFRLPLGIEEEAAAAAGAVGGKGGKHAAHHQHEGEKGKPQPSRSISLNHLGNWTSVGGGGGCGTTDVVEEGPPEASFSSSSSSSSSSSNIMCGRELDADASRDQRKTEQLAQALQWCVREGHALRMTGGGGGGGGTGECCAAFQVGYGFSFDVLIRGPAPGPPPPLQPPPAAAVGKKKKEEEDKKKKEKKKKHGGSTAHHHHLHHGHGRRLSPHKEGGGGGEGKGADAEANQDAAIAAQLRYDPLFQYLYSAAKACPIGFQDWCCVCSGAKVLLAGAAQPDSRLAWFADVTCCTGTNQAQVHKRKTGKAAAKDPGQASFPWKPEDDLPFFPPPSWPVGDKSAGGCELQLDATGRGLVVQAKAAPKEEEALLWRLGGVDQADATATGGGERMAGGLWGSLVILSALVFVLAGVVLTRQRRQQRSRGSRRSTRRGEEEDEGGHLLRQQAEEEEEDVNAATATYGATA